MVNGLAAKGALARGLDVDTATDILLTVFSDATYHSLRAERDWSRARVADWLAEALPRLLLDP